MESNSKEKTIRRLHFVAENSVADINCSTCGKALTEADQVNSGSTRYNINNNVRFKGDITNTIAGLLLLGIGTGIAWIPIVQYLGILFNLIGVVLIFSNSHNFESNHSNLVIISVAIYLFSLLIAIVGSMVAVGSIVIGTLATIIAGTISSIAYYTITYGIQDKKGKLLLVIGLMWYFYIEAIDVAILYINSSYLLNNLSYTYPYYPYAIGLFSHKLLSYSVLVVIPPLINAIAYLRIKSIILKEATKDASAVKSF